MGRPCNNDDGHHHSGIYSYCLSVPPGDTPVGLTPDQCGALAETSAALLATPTPGTLQASKPTAVTVTTSFDSSFLNRLIEGLCADSLTWDVAGWSVHWPDGAVTAKPGTAQSGTSATHTLAPTGSAKPINVDVVAHLHVRGVWPAFDPSGNIVYTSRDFYVDVSNNPALMGGGPAVPTYTPPRLAVGALAAVQSADGTMPEPTQTAARHYVTIRGRLFELYPRVIVLEPGQELLGGAPAGDATSIATAWIYTGPVTDAPGGTSTGTTGPPATRVLLQWDNPEPVSPSGDPLDEQVPLTLTVTTRYPDGHTLTDTVSGAVAVTIYYPALASP